MNDYRTFLTFESDIIDDTVFSDSGKIIIPQGEVVSTTIRKLIENIGFDVSIPIQHKFYGWEFEARKDSQKYWFLIQRPEDWLLIAEERLGFLERLKNKSTLFHSFLEDLNDRLSASADFDDIRWFSEKEYGSRESAGETAP